MVLIDTAEELRDGFKGVLKPNEVLTTMHDCTVGVATENEKGYTRTNYKVNIKNYHKAKKIVQYANFLIAPKLDGLSIARIIASTL